MNELNPIVNGDHTPETLRNHIHSWFEIAKDAVAENTLIAYHQDWSIFIKWCENQSAIQGQPLCPLPASVRVINTFIDDMIGKRAPASIRRCLTTVSKIHDIARVNNPFNDILVQTAKQKIGTGLSKEKQAIYDKNSALVLRYAKERALPLAQRQITEDKLPKIGKDICHDNFAGNQRQAAPIMRCHLKELNALLPVEPLLSISENNNSVAVIEAKKHNTKMLKRARNLAILHLAYDSLLRVSELTRVKIEDFTWDKNGSGLLKIGKRKDNRQGDTAYAYITQSSAKVILRWIALLQRDSGYMCVGLTKSGQFRATSDGNINPLTTRAIHAFYKEMADLIGLDKSQFSCHSTRVGAVHDMHNANINMPAIKQAGRWKTDVMPSRYMRKSEAKQGAMAQMEKLDT